MPDRETDRRRTPGRTDPSPSPQPRSPNPVLTLQRAIGNRAVVQVLAREPVRTGSVEIPGIGKIAVKGGNLADWDSKEIYDTVQVTSKKGKHSAKLDKLSKAKTKQAVKVMIAPAGNAGEDLNVGGGTLLEIDDAQVEGYSVDSDGVETWRLGHFEHVHRTTITRRVGAG